MDSKRSSMLASVATSDAGGASCSHSENGDERLAEEEDLSDCDIDFLPPAEFTQALASKCLLSPSSFRSTQPSMGISASTMLSK